MAILDDRTKWSSRIGQEKRILIDEIDTSRFIVTGKDFQGTTIQVSFDFQKDIVTIPQQGELWVINRYQNEWRLDRKAESNAHTSVTELQPGDKRLETEGNLYLNAASVFINGAVVDSWLQFTDGGQIDIASAAITPTSSMHTIISTGGTLLTTINQGIDGRVLYLWSSLGGNYTVVDIAQPGGSNILTRTRANVVVGSGQFVGFIYKSNIGNWIQIV